MSSISLLETKNFVDMLKNFKCDTITFKNGYIYGYDCNYHFVNMGIPFIKAIPFDLEINNEYYYNFDCNLLLQTIQEYNITDIDIYIDRAVCHNSEQSVEIVAKIIPMNFILAINNTYYIMNKQCDYSDDNVLEHPVIQTIMSSLAKDGAYQICINGYFIILYKGMIPANKGENIEFKFYEDEINNCYYYLDIIVYKKKKIILHTLYHFRKL